MRKNMLFGRSLGILSLTALSFVVAGPPASAANELYPGEERIEAAGYPAIMHFTAGEADKPLIVFAPGAHHMGRIVYGGHDGARDEDFLAHHLAAKGYNVLALTYPIETESGVFKDAYPDFTVQAWAQQIAEAAARTIKEHDLTGDVYLAAWSMGGKVMQPAHSAMKKAGVPLVAVFSFAATPGIPGVITMTRELDKAPSGYADRTDIYDGWYNQIKANSDEGGPAIPEDIYKKEYVGHISINQQGYGEVHQDGKVKIDHMAQAQDYGAFAFGDFPLVAIFLNDEPADARHGLIDEAYWSFYNTNTLYAQIRDRKISAKDLPKERWGELIELSREAGERLSVEVGGNHFFFVGEEGASGTADAVDEAIDKVKAWNAEVERILSE